MSKYKPSGYVILNLEEHPLSLGDTITITDKEVIEKCKCGKPVLFSGILDDSKVSAMLTRQADILFARLQTMWIQIVVSDDEIELSGDELA